MNKNIDSNIKMARDFFESWTRLHKIFQNALSESSGGKKKENEFFLTRNLISARFEDLMDNLGVRPSKRIMDGAPIYSVLGLEDFSAVSDETLQNISREWKDSFIILGGLLSRLERNKKRLKNFNRFSLLVKKRKKQRIARRHAK